MIVMTNLFEKIQTKLFCGSFEYKHVTADTKFNKWIEEHPNIEILEFRYQQARYGDHSIAILYREKF